MIDTHTTDFQHTTRQAYGASLEFEPYTPDRWVGYVVMVGVAFLLGLFVGMSYAAPDGMNHRETLTTHGAENV